MRWEWAGFTALGLGGLALAIRSMARRVSGPVSRIIAPGVSIPVTDDDWLWLARACVGESRTTEGQIAVAWCMLQRLAALAQHSRTRTLAEVVKGKDDMTRAGYSQPVAVQWRAPESCVAGAGCCGRSTGPCAPERIENRRRCRNRSWTDIAREFPEFFELFRGFQTGNPPENPIPGMTDFAACSQVEGFDVGGNCFMVGTFGLSGEVSFG